MNEFISILISFIFMSLADSVDSAFNNYISIDAIVVCGSLIFIKFILKSIGEVGIYTYRVVRKNESSYLLISGIVGLILGVFSFVFSDVLANLFELTIVQKELLSNVLKLFIIYLPISILHVGLLEIIRLKNELKLYRKGLIITYISLIGLDLLAFIFTKNLLALLVATILSDAICFTYLSYKTKIKFKKLTKKEFENIKAYGILYSLERVLSRIFILIYGILSSYMGESKYAIHSICYSICLNLEIITNAYSAALMIKIPEEKDKFKQLDLLKEYMKKCFIIVLVINFIMSLILLIIEHGSLPINECFPYIILYSCTVFGLYLYESYKAICVVQGKTKILLEGSIVGVIVRVIFCLLFLKTPICLYVFGLASFIDFFTRGVIYKRQFLSKPI